MSTKDVVRDADADLQVYSPHRAGLPRFGPYFRDLRARLPFAAESSKASIRAAHSQTVFGQLWLILNPLLMALVYYILVVILRGSGGADTLAHIVSGLFVFHLVSGSMSAGASSVTGGGRLIMNMAFPRLLMPMSAVRTAFFRFLPTLPVVLILKAFTDEPWGPQMLLALVFLGFMTLFSIGIAAVLATLQVYFRDTSSFLPFFTRIWLYMSPILWSIDSLDTSPVAKYVDLMVVVNPLFSMVGGWTELVLNAQIPSPSMWLAAASWAVGMTVVGSLFFMSREREFAVRL
ncbi:ABC transporter permease [Cellulomonas uda]|uniref:Transport permease protein n=1 Tax=Cellulomonas uda TaxID=1714 RepID=A0A4Y3K7A9_CELUD|nr:ABC transporter permease [Cellulomonas uda]NII65282.1 teichoic acid transport system permease protein [Cellulomonas uda]GEA79817.1 transport permease protein [Cellulomonas uda]